MTEKMFDINEFQKQFKALVEENKNLENLKNNYISYSDKLLEVSNDLLKTQKILESLAKEIDPVKATVSRNKYQKVSKEILNEIYDKLQAGTYITMAFLDSVYKFDYNSSYQIMQKLKGMPNVEKTKDGRTVRLFRKSG